MSLRVLWCGGSHLATASAMLRARSAAQGVHSVFHITAGAPTARWNLAGGRYERLGPSTVRGHRDERLSVSDKVDLAGWDAIVFVGQYVQPSRVFADTTFDWHQPLGAPLVQAFCRHTFARPPVPDFDRQVVNEAPALFRSLADPDCRCLILADPFVRVDAVAAPNRHYLDAVPLRLKLLYYEAFDAWYAGLGLVPLRPPPALTDPATMGTPADFARHDDDDWHMNDNYWSEVIDRVLWPALTAGPAISA